ncbi:HlyD family secretion protein [Rhizosaccharibacter radicis]|uniref:HlyD family secretion protein n=1 Tax=Rhizosaccharibacter radicis TaxID=2782605 RepID=A0ABT1VX60_9PROT|nr:HlyD family secretion protein [Acetobacteraceae bacterium KSS12]
MATQTLLPPAALSPRSADRPPAAETAGRASSPSRRMLMLAGAVLVAGVGGRFGWQYWTVGRFQVSTDDAYVQADNTTVAPRISGYLSAVLVRDNQPVRAGQVLAKIDDRDFRVAVDQATADADAARAALEGRRVALAMQDSVIASARATVAVDASDQRFAEQDDRRYAALAQTGYGTVQDAQRAGSRISAARAGVVRDVATLQGAIRQADQLAAQVKQAEATLAHDEAVLAQARLDLGYTTIVAAVDGTVGNRTLRVGQYVQAGTQLMSIVPLREAYVVANYKETQLSGVHPGQRASVEVDMFPGLVAHGRVDSMAPASGAEFALLPPDNATGNFTKIVQRIPVKIVLDPGDPLTGRLRPGMSAYPSIDIRDGDRGPAAGRAAPTGVATAGSR